MTAVPRRPRAGLAVRRRPGTPGTSSALGAGAADSLDDEPLREDVRPQHRHAGDDGAGHQEVVPNAVDLGREVLLGQADRLGDVLDGDDDLAGSVGGELFQVHGTYVKS